MSVFAELADGRRLEFPDGTDPSVIQSTVKKIVGAVASAEQLPPSADEIKKMQQSSYRGEHPVLAGVGDFINSNTGIVKGILNIPGKIMDHFTGENTSSLGDRLDVNASRTDTPAAIAGSVTDPAGMAVMGGISRAVPVVAQAAAKYIPKVPYLGQYTQGLVSGATGGATLGALSNESDAGTGAAIGATASAVLPPVLSAAAKGIPWAVDLLKGRLADIKAGKVLREVAGDELPKIRAALTAAGQDVTASQAAADVGSTKWSALGQRAAQNDSQYTTDLLARQAADRQQQVAGLAGGNTTTAAKQAVDSAKGTLNAVTTPMRDAELGAANAGGDLASTLQPTQAMGATQAINTATAQGLPPIDTRGVVSRITSNLNNPKMAGSKPVQNVLSNVADQISQWTAANGGVIDAQALYSIRKNAVSAEVARLNPGATEKAQAKMTASILSHVNPLIDDAIEAAGGTGWRNYLKTYSDGMNVINQMKLGGKALEALNQSPDEFLKLVRGNNPKVVQKIFGSEYDIGAAMGPQKTQVLSDVASQLERDQKLASLATAGTTDTANILESNASRSRLPSLFNRTAAVINKGMDIAEGELNRKVMDKVYTAMRNGQSANSAMDSLSTYEKSQFYKALQANKYNAQPYVNWGLLSGQQNGQQP